MHSRLQHAKVFYEEKKIKKCFLSKTMISYKKVLLLLFWQKFGRTQQKVLRGGGGGGFGNFLIWHRKEQQYSGAYNTKYSQQFFAQHYSRFRRFLISTKIFIFIVRRLILEKKCLFKDLALKVSQSLSKSHNQF